MGKKRQPEKLCAENSGGAGFLSVKIREIRGEMFLAGHPYRWGGRGTRAASYSTLGPLKAQPSLLGLDPRPSTLFPALLAALLFAFSPLALRAVTFSELLAQPAPAAPIAYGSGPAQSLWMFVTGDLKPGEARPGIVLIHGGAWVGGGCLLYTSDAADE